MTIERGLLEKTKEVSKVILEKLHKMDPYEFERFNGELVDKMGYGKFHPTTKSNDKGIDGYCTKDQFGFDRVKYQSKRYQGNVRASELRDFLGSLHPNEKGIMIATSDFPSDSEDVINHNGRSVQDIILVNGMNLVKLMIEHNLGVKNEKIPFLVDEEYFKKYGI